LPSMSPMTNVDERSSGDMSLPSTARLQGMCFSGFSSSVVDANEIRIKPVELRILETVMPKQKTHKATRKRVKVTATGKVLVQPTGARHMMSGTSSKSRRHMRRARPLKASDRVRAIRSLRK